MKRLLTITFILIVLGQFLQAQDTSKCAVSCSFGCDVVSRYVWRGAEYGDNVPNFQPSFMLVYKNLDFGIWGSYSFSKSNLAQEFDTYLQYSLIQQLFTLTLTDYFFPNQQQIYNYFDYAANTTGHVLEGTITFNGSDKIPFTFLAAVNFFGADAARIDNNFSSSTFNQKTGIQYSNYFELGYKHSFKTYDFNAFAGFTLTNPRLADTTNGFLGESGYYASTAGVVNVGFKAAKSIQITENYSLPVYATISVNPISKKVFYVFGITF